MNNVEVLKRRGKIKNVYNNTDTLPIIGLVGIGLNIYNTDVTNELIITIITDDGNIDIEIPSKTAWSDYTPAFKGLIKSGSSSSYKIQVREEI